MKTNIDTKSSAAIQKTARMRASVLKTVRQYFQEQSYIEIDAPILLYANAVESQIDPLHTDVCSMTSSDQKRLYLMTSPEIHMKRLLSHGLTDIFFLGHVFRDREFSPIHSNEFTMLEWYNAQSDLNFLICQCEILFREIALTINGSPKFVFKDHQIALDQPFDRISMASAWETFAGIDLLSCLAQIDQGDHGALVREVLRSGESLRPNADFEDAFTHIMLKKIEPMIGRTVPCVIYDWPAQTAALARLNPENHLIAQRFEIYCGDVELANAFAELTDANEQRKRFVEANQIRADQHKAALPISESFLSDLEKMPPACGIAVGIDRLICLISGAKDLREIICFPV